MSITASQKPNRKEISMSMSTYVVGFRPPDAEYKIKADAWRACKAAGVRPPEELSVFFDYTAPDDAGQIVDIKAAVEEYSRGAESGLEVDVAKLPPGVKIIRFSNSW
jgi:hypothetical protein